MVRCNKKQRFLIRKPGCGGGGGLEVYLRRFVVMGGNIPDKRLFFFFVV